MRAASGTVSVFTAQPVPSKQGAERSAVHQIIFITDGAVGNESALIQAIHDRLGKSRLYTIGIGSAPNSHFMSKAAEFGRGTFTYIASPAQIEEKMNELFAKLDSPVLHDLEIAWDVLGAEAWPERIPDVYLGESRGPLEDASGRPARTQLPRFSSASSASTSW